MFNAKNFRKSIHRKNYIVHISSLHTKKPFICHQKNPVITKKIKSTWFPNTSETETTRGSQTHKKQRQCSLRKPKKRVKDHSVVEYNLEGQIYRSTRCFKQREHAQCGGVLGFSNKNNFFLRKSELRSKTCFVAENHFEERGHRFTRYRAKCTVPGRQPGSAGALRFFNKNDHIFQFCNFSSSLLCLRSGPWLFCRVFECQSMSAPSLSLTTCSVLCPFDPFFFAQRFFRALCWDLVLGQLDRLLCCRRCFLSRF